MKEIGSEFWSEDLCGNIKGQVEVSQYAIAGRTALDGIIKDILKERKIDSACLPSYCCHTMIEPFLKNGISVGFYEVSYQIGKGLVGQLPKANPNEILYVLSYFGYQFQSIEIKGNIFDWEQIIEDKTHSIWRGEEFMEIGGRKSDYWFASYRKWFFVPGLAKVKKREGMYHISFHRQNTSFLRLRTQAGIKKASYIEGKEKCKNKFLGIFKEAEELLEADYAFCQGSAESIDYLKMMDTQWMCKKRRNNAKILIEGMKKIPQLHLMYPFIEKEDTPLCVPILIKKEERDELRPWLIEEKIYCPIHWPLGEVHKYLTPSMRSLYEQELSLVCDQRYNTKDMERIVEVIDDFYLEKR